MKQLLFSFYMVLCCFAASAQSFEGKIAYHNSYKSKLPNVTSEQFATMMGSTQNYFIKDGDYKSETNGNFMLWQLYINKDKKLYNKFSNSADILWNDVTVDNDKVLSSEVNKGVVDILGYKCDELVLHCKSGTQKYYYTSKLHIDSKLYADHLYGNWAAFVTRTNALPLKITMETAQFSFESIAIEVNPAKLDRAFFVLPAGIKTGKSPY